MEQTNLFTTLVEDEDILKALQKMKFTTATPVQEQSIRPMSEGLDVTVQAPTGTGKTCAFSIPIIQNIDPNNKDVQAIVLSPTRELAVQIAEVMRDLTEFKKGIRVATIYGGERIEKQFADLRKKPQIIVATPGRLIDHMERRTIKLADVKIVVLDEADRMLDMGFRPDLNRILKEVPDVRQTALYSATLSREIKEIAKTYQQNAKTIRIGQDTLTVKSVKQFYIVVNKNCKEAEMVELLRREHPKLTIAFCNTKRMTEKVVYYLRHHGYRAAYLHGDLRQAQRNRVMSQYRTGKLDILVATDVAARGIDVNNIDMVLNYDLPQENENYVHRIGRTGRANQTGAAYTLIYRNERYNLDMLMRETRAKITPIDAVVKKPPLIEMDMEALKRQDRSMYSGSSHNRSKRKPDNSAKKRNFSKNPAAKKPYKKPSAPTPKIQ